MRDFRDAKPMAQTLREALKAKSISITNSESIELIAKALGFHDWNELSSKIEVSRATVANCARKTTAPRSCSLRRASRSYPCGILCCSRRWSARSS